MNVDALERLESTGKTVDITPTSMPTPPAIWAQPIFIIAAAIAGLSVIVNIILIALLAAGHK